MKIKCGWCDKDMGEKEPIENREITHGICKDCVFKKIIGKKSRKENFKKIYSQKIAKNKKGSV